MFTNWRIGPFANLHWIHIQCFLYAYISFLFVTIKLHISTSVSVFLRSINPLYTYLSLTLFYTHHSAIYIHTLPLFRNTPHSYSYLYLCISSLCQPFIYLSSLTLFYTRNSAFSRHVRSTSMIHVSPLLKTPPTTHFAFTVLCAPRQSQHPIQLHCISLGDAYPLHMFLTVVTYLFNNEEKQQQHQRLKGEVNFGWRIA